MKVIAMYAALLKVVELPVKIKRLLLKYALFYHDTLVLLLMQTFFSA